MKVWSRAYATLALATSACFPVQRHLRPADVRPLPRASGEVSTAPIPGIRAALAGTGTGATAVRILTVHGMITANIGFSEPWQDRIAKRLGLVRRATQDHNIVRGYDVTIFAGPQPFEQVKAKPSHLRISRWSTRGDTAVDRLIFYELTWAPMRDIVKNRFLACFESRSLARDVDCRPFTPARPNSDRRAGINGAAKDMLLIAGFADASIVLSPLADVVRDDLDQAMCYVASQALVARGLRGGESHGGRCDLAVGMSTASDQATAESGLAGVPFFAITHSLGSFLLMDAQEIAARKRASGIVTKSRESVAYRLLGNATVYMFANQVSLLGLSRLTASCTATSLRDSCPPRTNMSLDSLAALSLAQPPQSTTYVAFNDVNDLLGYELPPYLAETGVYGRLVNVSVRNPALALPRLFKNPGDVHTRQSDNPAIIEAIVEGMDVPPAGTAPAPPARWYAGPVGLHFGTPAGPSLALGVLRSVACNPVLTCGERETSLMLVGEPGINGGRVSFGLARMSGGLGAAWTARGTYLQRWNTDTRRYAGLEMSWHPALFIGARLGAFARLGGEHRSTLWTLDASIGL